MAESQGKVIFFFMKFDFRLLVIICSHGAARRPKNIPQECFLNGLSNPRLFWIKSKGKVTFVTLPFNMAESQGFEPWVLAYTAFRVLHLRPLGQLSVW